ncbi:MAG: Trk system potassium transporter TrkA [Prevotellaceae bacterium]|jgi:trk system potassium uptake protein TrkA|nr:Trk system potassium transporter TrkA [Prevotellaceae bacterium]
MKIVIAGAGEVGSHLAMMLGEGHHSITVIDHDEDRLRKAAEAVDLMAIHGMPTSIATLERAHVDKADLFIAVSPSVEQDMNVVSAAFAKKMGAKKVIARINNDEYLQPEHNAIFTDLGIDYLFYPEKNAVVEILNLLSQTGTTEFMDFSGGHLQLIAYKLEEGAPVINKSLNEVSGSHSIDYRAVAISRNGKTIIPTGADKFKEDDLVFIVTNKEGIQDALKDSGKSNVNVRKVLILGGTRIGVMLAAALEGKVEQVKLIDSDREHCERLAEELPETLIICGDIRNTDLLMEEDICNIDAFVAVTGSSETNILSCIFAKRMGVKKTIAEIENIDYIHLAENMGVDTIINKKIITAGRIFRFTMGSNVQSIRLLNGSEAEVLEFIVKSGSPVTKGKIRDIDFPKNAVIGGVVRGNTNFIAVGDSEIKPYDRVVVVSLPSVISMVSKFFE